MIERVADRVASFILYVAGNKETSRTQRDLLTEAFARLGEGVSFEVVDVLEDPVRAELDRVLTTPMLVRWHPAPVQRLVGDVTAGDIARLVDAEPVPDHVEPTRPAPADRSSEILSRAAHELRTPLAVIRGFAATLQDAVGRMDREMSSKAADAIVRSSLVLQTMLESMLVLEAVEIDGLKLDLSDWELGDIALETLRDVQPLLRKHIVRTTIQDGVWVRVDAAKIRQVLTNLLTNAVKYSEPGTRVSVAVHTRGSLAVFAVEDEGKGIRYEHLKQLFGKYERLGRSEKGTGLGLYIARGLATAHGGEVTAFSDGQTGSRFELTLPLIDR